VAEERGWHEVYEAARTRAAGAPDASRPLGIQDQWPSSSGARSLVARAFSVVWALVPVATLGLGTAPAFTYAAFRLRSKVVGWWALFYWLCLTTALAFDRPLQSLPESSWRSQAQEWIQWIVLIVLGTTHAFLIRRRVLEGTRDSDEAVVVLSGIRRVLGIPPLSSTGDQGQSARWAGSEWHADNSAQVHERIDDQAEGEQDEGYDE